MSPDVRRTRRMRLTDCSAKKLNKGQDVMFEANLTNVGQTVRAYVMCDTIGSWARLLRLELLLTTIAGTMRSAILQPDVPPHVFPISKATQNSNDHSGKPISKRTSSKSKTGSKRRTSKTGLDEFDDAGIDDADLALAETGGFENIDDYDDEPRPNVSASRKKQKTSIARDNEITTHEPRQLANGKWACNHNCKDKTSCKHLCCREGLDKKPKPSKAKTSKKEAEDLSDPKQTQLSLSVSKKAKTPAATQQRQSQKTAPAPVPPKGPEAQSLNTLHKNAKSNTQPVPLLSTASSRMEDFDRPVDLPRPGQPRFKTTEAARSAAQNVYSDDFGDIDDMSLFDEPTAHHFSTHLSPPGEAESDLFGTDTGDMLDRISAMNKGNLPSHEDGYIQDEHKNESSLFGGDDDMLLPLEQALNEARQPDPFNAQQGIEKSAAPFLEVSDESAILSLGIRANDQGSSSTVAKTPSGYRSAIMESHPLHHDNAYNNASEERPTTSDAAMEACMEELGTDFFNFTG